MGQEHQYCRVRNSYGRPLNMQMVRNASLCHEAFRTVCSVSADPVRLVSVLCTLNMNMLGSRSGGSSAPLAVALGCLFWF